MENKTSKLNLLTGLLLGIAIGLAFALLIMPAQNLEASPPQLSPSAKDSYRLIIADAYEATARLERASSRLNLLADPDPREALVAQAQALVAAGGEEADARALALLAMTLGETPAP